MIAEILLGITGNLAADQVRQAIEYVKGPHNGDLEHALAAAFRGATHQLAHRTRSADLKRVAERLEAVTQVLFPTGEVTPTTPQLLAQQAAIGAILNALLLGDESQLRQSLTSYIDPYITGESIRGELEQRLPAAVQSAFGDVLKDEHHRRAWIAFQREVLQRLIELLQSQATEQAGQRHEIEQLVARLQLLLDESPRLADSIAQILSATSQGLSAVQTITRQQSQILEQVIAIRMDIRESIIQTIKATLGSGYNVSERKNKVSIVLSRPVTQMLRQNSDSTSNIIRFELGYPIEHIYLLDEDLEPQGIKTVADENQEVEFSDNFYRAYLKDESDVENGSTEDIPYADLYIQSDGTKCVDYHFFSGETPRAVETIEKVVRRNGFLIEALKRWGEFRTIWGGPDSKDDYVIGANLLLYYDDEIAFVSLILRMSDAGITYREISSDYAFLRKWLVPVS